MSRTVGAFLAATAVAVVAAPSLAPAETMGLQVTYSVTGGSFGGPGSLSSGPVTGGTVGYLLPGVTVTNPTGTVFGSLTSLVFSGPSGFFSLQPGALPFGAFVGAAGPVSVFGASGTTVQAASGSLA